MPAPTSVIAASGLSFAWPDGTPALRDLDLLVGPGRSGLVGTNGAGSRRCCAWSPARCNPPPDT